MQTNRELLKDLLWNDTLFNTLAEMQPELMYQELLDFREDLVLQLREIEGDDTWRRKVTALIIRTKGRIREMEDWL